MDEDKGCLVDTQPDHEDATLASGHCEKAVRTRICLVGDTGTDTPTYEAAQTFGHPVVLSETGSEYLNDGTCDTVFVTREFSGPVFEAIHQSEQRILGPTALRECAEKGNGLPSNSRPLYSLAMSGLVICFTGFRKKDELNRLILLIHHMGGSIRKDMVSKVTHLISNYCGGDKYHYAVTFRVPIMSEAWVATCWDQRDTEGFVAASEDMMRHKLKPFHGARVCFYGFSDEERWHMAEVLQENGGTPAELEEAACSHVVLDGGETYDLLKANVVVPKPARTSFPRHTSTPIPSREPDDCCYSTPPKVQRLRWRIRRRRLGRSPSRPGAMATPGASVPDCSGVPTLQCRTEEGGGSGDGGSSCASSSVSSSSCSSSPEPERPHAPGGGVSPARGGSPGSDVAAPDADAHCSCVSDCTIPADFFKTPAPKGIFFSSGRKRLMPVPVPSYPPSAQSYQPLPPPSCGNPPIVEEEFAVTAPVVDELVVHTVPEKAPLKAYMVKAEWFWASVQNEVCADEKEYLFEDYLEAMLSPSSGRQQSQQSTPGSRARKRKRLRDAVSRLVQIDSPAVHKRRSSVSDAGLLSMSGSFIDGDHTLSPEKKAAEGAEESSGETPRKSTSPRHQVFLELVQTESNYVGILHTIMSLFKRPLEDMAEGSSALLNNTELKIIFGNVPPIYDVHCRMLEELRATATHWREDSSVGSTFVKYAPDLVKAYPPFVNFFETTRETLAACDQSKPRFHAFLKICQTRAECGRQSLQELLIRPVQRLPSISLLLNDILKHTSKGNADHAALEHALSAIREVMTHINEDKRKTEGQLVMFDIFNDIDNCPPHLVSSHRSFIVRCDVMELSDGLSGRGDSLVFFLFSDTMEVCKKRSRAFNSLKSPNTTSSLHTVKLANGKPYKHVRLLPLSNIRRVIDIHETDDCHNVFALMCRSNQEMKDKLYSFTLADDETDKVAFLRTLCRQMANAMCKTDAEAFMASLDSRTLDIDTSDVTLGTLSKAFKFASRTRLKVGRAFSFNKTPSKLKRAVSTMMSPFGSTTNLTPASQLAQMRLASCNNLNELGSSPIKGETSYMAPMSVQPTRKNKCSSSLNMMSLRRL